MPALLLPSECRVLTWDAENGPRQLLSPVSPRKSDRELPALARPPKAFFSTVLRPMQKLHAGVIASIGMRGANVGGRKWSAPITIAGIPTKKRQRVTSTGAPSEGDSNW